MAEKMSKPRGDREQTAFKRMYGLVNKAVQEMVTQHYGESMWEKVREKAGVEDEIFLSSEAYPDEVTYRLVGAASALVGEPADRILFAFGEHWVLHTARHGYGSLMDAAGKSLPEFIRNLPNFHTRIAMIFPKLSPPRFEVTDETAGSLRLHYYTHRPGLTEFVRGLLSGLGRKFGTRVRTTSIESKVSGADHDVFLVEWELP